MVLESRVEDRITVHAWNADRTLLAVCPNSNEVIIFKTPGSADGPWERTAVLKEHDALVTGIAWAPKTNRIITTAQDRNAYVWTLEEDGWKPMLVILRIAAAATSVEWSVDEQKFAVGSGAKIVPVCYYEEANKFWVSKMIKGHKSTISAVCWHPSAPIVATASTDFRCRIFSAYLKNVDGKKVNTPWGESPKFGTCFYEVQSPAWVRHVAFSPQGDTLAYCSHNSTVTLVDVASQQAQTLRLSELPLNNLLFLPDGELVGVGHTYNPILFVNTSNGWREAGQLMAIKNVEKRESVITSRRKMFQAQATTGQLIADAQLQTVHQNLVMGLQPFNSTMGGVKAEFTTSALDGQVVFWTRDELSAAMASMSL